MVKKIIICLVLGIGLVGLSGCSTTAPSPNYLTEDEVRVLIQNDTEIIMQRLNSLAKSSYGKNYLADLLEKDLELMFELVWYEAGERAGKTIGFYDDPFDTVTQKQVDKALFHKITLSVKTSPSAGYGLGHWLIYPDGTVMPSPSALRLEAELVK